MEHWSDAVGAPLTRRSAIRLGAGVIGLTAVGTAAGCGVAGDDEPGRHPLQGLYDAAREDVELFADAQAQFPAAGAEAIALAQIGAAREVHRVKLAAAMEADGTPAVQTSTELPPAGPEQVDPGEPKGPAEPATSSSAPKPEPPSFAELTARLDAAADAARHHALGDYGYRRVLAASIGAACTAGSQVLLAPLLERGGN